MKIKGVNYTYEIKEIPTVGLLIFMTEKYTKTRSILGRCTDIEDGVAKVNQYEHYMMLVKS